LAEITLFNFRGNISNDFPVNAFRGFCSQALPAQLLSKNGMNDRDEQGVPAHVLIHNQ
jgi:hypothetical protein